MSDLDKSKEQLIEEIDRLKRLIGDLENKVSSEQSDNLPYFQLSEKAMEDFIHKFNNLLHVILGHSDLAYNDADENSVHRQHLSIILQATERAATLVQQLRDSSGK